MIIIVNIFLILIFLSFTIAIYSVCIFKESGDIKEFLNESYISSDGISSWSMWLIDKEKENDICYIVISRKPYTIKYYGTNVKKVIFPFTKLHFKIKRYEKLLKQGYIPSIIKRDEILNNILK
jgi:hypothetical protein